MLNLCIPKEKIDKFREALKSKKISLADLLNAPTDRLIDIFKPYLGDKAKDAALLFEQKRILKNRLLGIKNAVSKIGEIGRYSPEKQAEIKAALEEFQSKQFERIFNPKEDEAFLNALADKIVGAHINEEQAREYFKLGRVVEELGKKYDPETQKWATPKDGYDYGAARVAFENYKKSLVEGKEKLPEIIRKRLREYKIEPNKPHGTARLLWDFIKALSDTSVSTVASVDLSFLGRQGLHTLMTHPKIWWKMAKKAINDALMELGGKSSQDLLWTDIYQRPNFQNGSYKIAKLIPKYEEQFPTSLPERTPVIGKIFRAAEKSFINSAIRSRIDLFDFWAKRASKNGVDMTDPVNIKALGRIVNSLTARGQWGKIGEPAFVRLFLWAPRMLKGNIDVLTGHLGQDLPPFARKLAAKNMAKIIGETALIMTMANAMKPGSAELDPRSSDFGKIRIGNTRYDITGGAGSIATLAARLLMNSTKSSTTGMVKPLGGGYGQRTRFDVFVDFLTGKATPPARVLVDLLKGKNWKGEKPTALRELYQAATPISIQNAIQLKDDKSADAVAGVILDALGINANTYQPYKTDWSTSKSSELKQFRSRVGDEAFKKANKIYNNTYIKWYNNVKKNLVFQALDDDTKVRVINNKKEHIKKAIFRKYHFYYRKPAKKRTPRL